METGFLYNAVCYATYNEAMSAKFSKAVDFYQIAGYGYINTFDYSNSVWTQKAYQMSSVLNPVFSSPIPTQVFPPCTMTATVFDPVLAGGLWMFGITMVLACYLIAKNIGLILEAIKRW